MLEDFLVCFLSICLDLEIGNVEWNLGVFLLPSNHYSVLVSSVAQSYPSLCDPMDCSTPGFSVHHQLLEHTQTHIHWVGEAIQPSPPLMPRSVFPKIRVFSNESVLCTRWPNYWSFSFNISRSNEYSGLISFRMSWLDLLAVQGTLKSLL